MKPASPSLGSVRSATLDVAERWLVGQGAAYAAVALLLCFAAAAGWLTERAELTLFVVALATTGMLHGGGDHVTLRELAAGRTSRFFVHGLYVVVALAAAALCLRSPLIGTGLFLVVSAWHFGTSDALAEGGARLPEVTARGLLPIATPLVVHPETSLGALAALSGTDPGALAPIAQLAPTALAAALVGAAFATTRGGGWRASIAVELGATLLIFAIAPPLAAFATYFAACHSARHLLREGIARSATRVADGLLHAIRDALGPTALALLAVAALAIDPRPAIEPWLGAGLAVLAALTLPHVMVTSWVARSRRRHATRDHRGDLAHPGGTP